MQKQNKGYELFAAIRAEASKVDHCMRQDLEELAPGVDGLLHKVLEYGLFNGGKRIRPVLVAIASRLCGGNDAAVYKLGCAFEYLHAATLFHDDIIDDSETRRGKPSVCKRFGNTPAILAGDFLLAYSMERIGLYAGISGLQIFCRAAVGMVDGEFLQLRNAAKLNLSELDYQNVIMGKTASLISAACEIGAINGGGSSTQQRLLREYGAHLGCAFQIVDDLLDYLGDPEVTGKAIGTDLLEGKVTLPLILTLNVAKPQDKDRLLEIIGSDSLRSMCFQEVCRIIEAYEGFAAAKNIAMAAVQSAKARLQTFDRAETAREQWLLEELASYVVERDK